MDKRVLFVSIAFPPKRDPECIQAGRYYKYLLKENGLKLTLLTAQPPVLNMPVDDSLVTEFLGNTDVVSIKIWENKYLNYFLGKLNPGSLSTPDSKSAFFKKWKSSVSKIDAPDLIYSRSFPLSSTIMALKLTEHFGVPWILHLSDPWAWSPLHEYDRESLKWNLEKEKECFERASFICLTSRQTVEKYTHIYPEFEQKFKLFPNVYDPEDVADYSGKDGDKIRNKIVYTGGLAGTRSPKLFLEILAQLFKKDQELRENTEVIFAGDVDRKNREVLKEFSFVNYMGPIDYEESKNLIKSADILLVIDSPIEDNKLSVFLPSKILDYMTTGNTIWAITTRGSATDSFLDDIDQSAVFYYNDSKINEKVKSSLSNVQRKKITVNNFYSAENQASRLIELFNNVK